MKARFLALAALVLGMASCQNDFDGASVGVGGEVDFQLSVAVPEFGATRADEDGKNGYDSAYGAIDYLSEADWANVDLRYTLEVYDLAAVNDPAAVPVKDRMIQVVDKYQPVSFELRLVPGRDYRFVVFADFVDANGEGLHHTLGTNLRQITVKNDKISQELTDAYFATLDVEELANNATGDIELTRPYGKVRVIATDLHELNLNVEAAKTVVTYDACHPGMFNAVTGDIDSVYEQESYEVVYGAEGYSAYTVGYDAMKDEATNRLSHKTLFTDYILAKDTQESIHFTMSVYDEKGGLIKTTHFNTEIPVQRNYLTTVIGNVLTTATEINVTIDDNFKSPAHEVEIVEVYNAEELAAALTANKETIYVVLGDNIDVPISSFGQQTPGSGEYKLGGVDTKSIAIDLNGKKLNITTTYWSGIGAKNDNVKFLIKNGTMTSSQASGTWNSYDLTFANCNYTFENVAFEKAIALTNVGKDVVLKNVSIKETHDYYAMWISAEGQNVTIDGLTIESAGRGIKIDEQYVDSPAKVTLNVNNATFKTVKKGAIVVKSVKGAEINLSNIDIANVKADATHAVWVDVDSADYADLVVVNGGLKIVEDGVSPFETEGAVVELAAGNYNFPAKVADNVTIKGEGVVMNMANNFSMSNVDYLTLEGITINWNAKTYSGFTHSTGHLYKGVTFNGAFFCYGQYAKFEDCTFNLNCNQYVWTYGSDVDFVNCEFNCVDGKGVLVYNEGVDVDVNFEGCEFSSSKLAYTGTGEPIAAIEINNAVKNPKFNVAINNCTSNGGFAYDACICRIKGDVKDQHLANLNITVDGKFFVSSAYGLNAAIAANKANIALAPAEYAGLFDFSEKQDMTVEALGEGAIIEGLVWANNTKAIFKGVEFTNPNGVKHPNTTNSQYFTTINNQYPLVGAYLNADVVFDECTFDIVGPTIYGFYGYANNTPSFNNCKFDCNGIRPIANNGNAITVTGCTFDSPYHYAVRIFENSNNPQTVTFTNNIVTGSNSKGEFEGVNISKKGSNAIVNGTFHINGNTAGLKYRYHKEVTMGDCTFTGDVTAFEREE